MIGKVENTTYTKNTETGSIINIDVAGYLARRKVINKNRIQEKRIANLESAIVNLTDKLEHIFKDKSI